MSNYIDRCPKCSEDAFHHWDYKRKWQEKCLSCGYEPGYEAQIAELETKLELAEKKLKRALLYTERCPFDENDSLFNEDGNLK